jgi:hypothetical protein
VNTLPFPSFPQGRRAGTTAVIDLPNPGAILQAIPRPKEGIMVRNARILAAMLLPLLAPSTPATPQSASMVEGFLNNFHIVEMIEGPADGRVTFRGTTAFYGRSLLTVQAVCSPTSGYLVVRDEERSTQDLYPLERAACVALFERLEALRPGGKNQ